MKQILKLFILILIISILSSCTTNLGYKFKVKVLENNTISHLKVNSRDFHDYSNGDTIWLNMETHVADDTCENAMKAVIIIDNKKECSEGKGILIGIVLICIILILTGVILTLLS